MWIYFWTVTHGGQTRDPNEYRIQMTGVEPPLSSEPAWLHAPTRLRTAAHAVLCWLRPPERHRNFPGASNSVQIPLNTLQRAQKIGIDFHEKGNGENAIGIRPDLLLTYTLTATTSTKYADDSATVAWLEETTENPEKGDEDREDFSGERKRTVKSYAALTRNHRFRRNVLNAYHQTCAVTGLQLELLDAAHILPVAIKGSTDATNNGLALAPTYHRALDTGLIYLDEDYVMHLNPAREEAIHQLDLAGGLGSFREPLERPILLPDDPERPPGPRPDSRRKPPPRDGLGLVTVCRLPFPMPCISDVAGYYWYHFGDQG